MSEATLSMKGAQTLLVKITTVAVACLGNKNSLVGHSQGGKAFFDEGFGRGGFFDTGNVPRADFHLEVGTALTTRYAVVLQGGHMHSAESSLGPDELLYLSIC